MARRRYSVEEKFSIVEEARQPDTSIAEVCRRHGIAASLFYRWEAQMREGARQGLAEKRGKSDSRDAEIDRLRQQLDKKNDVIAELTEALIQEKKGLSDYLRGNGFRRK
jgi:transposase